MNSQVLSDWIDIEARIRGIKEYSIEGMSLLDGNIDVRIKPKSNEDEIIISVKENKHGY
jgi:hypothetical protein